VFSALAGVGRQLAGESENVARGGAARAPERTDRLRVGDEAPPGEEEYRPDIASHGQARQPAGKRPPRRRLGALAQMKIDSQTRGNVYYIFTGAAGAAA
jgi:hypothetical protein